MTGRPPRVSVRLAAAALTLAAVATAPGTASAASSAGADRAPVVTTQGQAFQLALPSLTLTSGASSASSTSGGDLRAEGAGLLAPSKQGDAVVTAVPGQSRSVPAKCAGPAPSLPSPFGHAVSLTVACGSATADASSRERGRATSAGQACQLSINLAPLLGQIVKPFSPALQALQGIFGNLPKLPGSGESLSSLLGTVVHALAKNQTLSASIGTSSSRTAVTPAGWSASSTANGSTISILPGAQPGGAALVKIMIGGTSAAASLSRPGPAGGLEKPDATDTPSLVTVEVDTPAGGPKTYSVVPGQSFTVLRGTPLQSTVTVAAGSVTTSPSGAETATAHGVRLVLLQGIGAASGDNGGLTVNLAQASAAAAGVSASRKTPQKVPPPPPPAVPNATVPHTGLPWAGAAPVLAGAAAAGAGLLWWPRRRRQRRYVKSRA
ncbi:MAG: hypothetical protein M0Z69_16565 [Actinomycetota bacterium]|nr:hypothetical protein [Actinomycetota bacterium]